MGVTPEDPQKEGMTTHSSILTWRIPWTEELGGLQSMGCKESDTTEVTWHARKLLQVRGMSSEKY